MQGRNPHKSVLEAEVVIRRADPVSRELTALLEEEVVIIHVPPGCDILLRDERVKLRLVQPGDRVRVTYTPRADALVARQIEVQPVYPSASLS